VDEEVATLVDTAHPAARPASPEPEPDETEPPPALIAALGPSRPLDVAQWRSLRALDRYALCKSSSKPEKLERAYQGIVGVHAAQTTSGAQVTLAKQPQAAPPVLRHVTPSGEAHMVDVGAKGETARRAVAVASVRTTREVVEAIAAGTVSKGDVLAVARVAGILAAKRTPELVPLCHPVRTTSAVVDIELDAAAAEVRVRATIDAVDRTGAEMEAMVAASIAALTVYDMIKSADRWATIDKVRLDAKSGGKSGDVKRPPERA
jgi:cyclic pyranopterin phosphate synthase